MSNENLDNDALATEEMLKMFEGLEIDDALNDKDQNVSLQDSNESLSDVVSHSLNNDISLADDLESLPEMDLANTSDAEILEIADPLDSLSLTETINEPASTLADMDEPVALEQPSLPEEDLPTIEEEVSMSDSDEPIEALTINNAEVIEETDIQELHDKDCLMIEKEPVNAISHETHSIAAHLQAVVANAIQVLQDWMQLRQEGEHKGPQQSLAQLDVLLDTVTNQQQYLAEQLANNSQQQLVQISSALGVELATPQTLGWSADDWRVKAQQVADKTDDINQRNAKLRQEIERL